MDDAKLLAYKIAFIEMLLATDEEMSKKFYEIVEAYEKLEQNELVEVIKQANEIKNKKC